MGYHMTVAGVTTSTLQARIITMGEEISPIGRSRPQAESWRPGSQTALGLAEAAHSDRAATSRSVLRSDLG